MSNSEKKMYGIMGWMGLFCVVSMKLLSRYLFTYSHIVLPVLVEYAGMVILVILTAAYIRDTVNENSVPLRAPDPTLPSGRALFMRKGITISMLLGPLIGFAAERLIYRVVPFLVRGIDSTLLLVAASSVIKILTAFFVMLAVLRVSAGVPADHRFLKSKRRLACAALAVIAVFCVIGEWAGVQVYLSMRAESMFGLMTAPLTIFQLFKIWVLPYAVRVCAVLFYLSK